MKQMRIRWRPGAAPLDDRLHDANDWMPMTPVGIRHLQSLVDAANEVFGAGTHWVEEREEPQPGLPPGDESFVRSLPAS